MSEKTVTYLILAFLGAFVIFGLCGKEVRNNGDGADAVRDEIRQAGVYNDEQSRRIGELEENVGELTDANQRIEAGEQEALSIIRQCQQDLRTIRERGEAETPES